MGNCLQTRLRSVVDDNTLKELGVIKYRVYQSGGNFASGVSAITAYSAMDMTVENGTIDGNTTIHINGGSSYFFTGKTITPSSGDYVTVKIPKYSYSAIQFSNYESDTDPDVFVDMADFKFASHLVSVWTPSSKVKLDIDTMNMLTDFRMGSATVVNSFDITDFGETGKLVTLYVSGASGGLYGSLDKVGLCPSISYLSVPGTQNVSLSIEQFVANQRSVGNTTGSIDIPWLGGCHCTFNGTTVPLQANNPLSWTATTITLNGVTITA